MIRSMQQARNENEISPAGVMAYNMVAKGGYYYPGVKQDLLTIKEASDCLEAEKKS